jgi:hypothetical protein
MSRRISRAVELVINPLGTAAFLLAVPAFWLVAHYRQVHRASH